MANLTAGAAHQAAVPVTVAPSGIPYTVKVVITNDSAGQNVVTQSNTDSKTSSGSAITSTVTITAPSTIGNFYVFTIVEVAGVVYAFAGGQITTVPTITVGPINWVS